MPKAPAFDADAQAFITAAGITDPTQQGAINTLVVSLKGYSIWTKFKAIYPIVGGTASQHKYNLKDPRDLDAAFRLAFATGWTHSATGMTPLVTWADTFLNSNNVLNLNSTNLSYYSRTNVNLTQVEIGALGGSAQDFLILRSAGLSYFVVHQNAPYTTYSNLDSRGFFVANRTASNIVNGWKNGVKVATSSNVSTGKPNLKIYLGAYNNGGVAAGYSTKECAFASIGDGLTDAEAANFYTAVQAFNTTLGRQV